MGVLVGTMFVPACAYLQSELLSGGMWSGPAVRVVPADSHVSGIDRMTWLALVSNSVVMGVAGAP